MVCQWFNTSYLLVAMQFKKLLTADPLNRSFFVALSLSWYGHGGGASQLMLCSYYAMYAHQPLANEFAALLGCSAKRFKDLCCHSAAYGAEDQLASGHRRAALPFIVARTFEYLQFNAPFLVLCAVDAAVQDTVESFCDSHGNALYESYSQAVSASASETWKFYLAKLFIKGG